MFRSGQHQQAQPYLSRIPTQSWYPPSVLSPPNFSRTTPDSTLGASSGSSSLSKSNPARRSNNDSRFQSSSTLPKSPSTPQSPTSFLTTFPPLREKSVEELKRLLTDKESYNRFFHSLDQVRNFDSLRDDLKNNNIQLAKHNLEKESQIAELRNQCTIIRTSELAAAREKYQEIEKREREVSGRLTAPTVLQRLQEAASLTDVESEDLHRQLLAGELELPEFMQKYRKLRTLYHKRVLTRLAAMSSSPPG